MAPRTSSAFAVTVGTYNVYCEDGHKSVNDEKCAQRALKTADWIATCPAHILALQETNQNFQALLESHDALVAAYPHRVFHNDLRRWGENRWGGAAVFSKFPITDDTVRLHRHGWYDTQVVDVDVNDDTTVRLYNIHLIANFPVNLFKVGGIREKEILHACDPLISPSLDNNTAHQPRRPVNVVLGDFNCRWGRCVDVMRKQCGMVSAQQVAHGVMQRATWRGFGFKAVFDHIFVDPKQAAVRRADVVQRAGSSDHLPLLAEIDIL